MSLTRLLIRDFRNIETADLALSPGFNFLVGANGSGKTSVLEAIYTLGHGRAFRSLQIGRVIRHEQEAFVLHGRLQGEERETAIGLTKDKHGMMMSLNRRIHRAYQRTRDANFSLEGLTGFTMHGKTAGVIGTGKIGVAALRILKGFGMRLLAFDPYPSAAALDMGVEYVDLETLYRESDVISLHCPLTDENYHLLNHAAFDRMKDGVMIINTSRGALIDSQAAIDALKHQKIGALGMDVYENERDLFFEDKSNDVIQDDVFRRLSACHNVLFTGHQAFLTAEALISISQTTLDNLRQVDAGETCPNALV